MSAPHHGETAPRAAQRGELRARRLELGPRLGAFLEEIVALGHQTHGHDDVARAGAAHQSLRRQGLRAERARARRAVRAQGAIFKVKLVVAERPSESLTSTRSMWSPAGNTASAMSMPVGCTNGLSRGVRSTAGFFM